MQKDYPSQRAYIATEDGYISTSDIEDEEDQDADEEDGEVLGDEATIGALLYSGCSAHKSSNLRSYNTITCSRFSSSSATVEHVLLLMEVAATIW